jgi:hypothetical protein
MLSSGSVCITADFAWIRTEPGKLRFFDANNKKQIWAANMAEDGSVKDAEVRSGYSNHLYRVSVPAGTAPRAFDLVDLTSVCRYRVEPV